ncbi:MAG TPA: adenylate/guanylate cyclase domain-containing protein [Candidatus Eremiobacteraceae bacterium]
MAEADELTASEYRARSFPSGIVAFLFTDIEGSTQRWDRHHDAMDAAVKRHDAILRGAIESHGGYVFKTVGDAFCASFARASDAIVAAVEIQRGLATEDFGDVEGVRVRAGLHVGEASERDGDYFGTAVNRVARLMSIGHGGQVLLSGRARDLIDAALPSETSLLDLGSRRLKDLTEPERVWQLNIDGLQREFPPLNSLDARPNNLPAQLTVLVGREVDVDEVKVLVEKHRLVTLLGSGGVGKTRLALQAAAELVDGYPNGVWFVDLAPISDPELVSSVVARALGVAQAQGRRVDETLVEWLKLKQLVLILDNCEHLVEAAALLADAIVQTCPEVRILSTSRQALGIHGERVHRLPSLSVPAHAESMHAVESLQFGAIALFAERASAADARFRLTDETASIVADICRRLDGIPLAIELAAARVKVLSIPNLATRLNDRFKLLTGGSRVAMPRQKTLIALIDWSYDLLTSREQTLFARIAIFAGGFGLHAVTAVCASEDIESDDILDLLSSLSDKSLLVIDTTIAQERYRLLESTRAYALGKLGDANERERFARKHAEYFRDRAKAADENFYDSARMAWLAQEELELDNYRAALDWSLADAKDVPLGAAIAGVHGKLWTMGGLIVEGRYWIVRAQAGLDELTHPREAARLWLSLADMSFAKPKLEYAERALALFEPLGDRQRSATALFDIAFALFQMGRLEDAEREIDRSMAAARECGDRRGIASCLSLKGLYYRSPGCDVAASRTLLAQSIEIFKSLGDERGAAAACGNLAELEFSTGDVEKAMHLVREALETNAGGKEAIILAIDHTNLAAYCIAANDVNAARVAAREGLKWALQGHHALGIAIVLQHFALLGALCNNVDVAARLIGHVDAYFEVLAYQREYTERWCHDKLMVALREHLTESEIDRLAAEGARWSEDLAVEQAMAV